MNQALDSTIIIRLFTWPLKFKSLLPTVVLTESMHNKQYTVQKS